ncbi:MAG: hypothetical protein NTV23_01510 [Propionibacteriales bacterium]|nr:hypothetical protein [Propionibacteriales bacterium]
MRQLVRAGIVLGILAASSVVRFDGSQAASSGEFYAEVEGQYATIEGSIGGDVFGAGKKANLLSGRLSLGELDSAVRSAGVRTLNGFAVPDGTKSGSRGDLVVGALAGHQLSKKYVQSTAPVPSGPASATLLPVSLAPIVSGSLIKGETMARWEGAFTRLAPGQVLTEAVGDTASLDILDLSSKLGGLKDTLPKLLGHPVVSVQTLRVHTQAGTSRNPDGTHGLTASGTGGLAALQIFGGADNGGVTLGLANHDTGSAKDTAGSRVWATGKQGGAGCSYVVPDLLNVAFKDKRFSLPISQGKRIELPGGLGYLDARFLGQSHCESSPDGTYARATGAGIGLSLHLTLPALPGKPAVEIGSFTVTLPDIDHATVKVPVGGIPPTDPEPVVEPPVPPAPAPEPPSVPSVVDSGLATTDYDVHPGWTVAIGAGVALILVAAARQWRRLGQD